MPIKYVLARCSTLALLILISGCNWQATPDNRAANEAAIRDLDAQWSKTAAAHDLNGTLSYFYKLITPSPPAAQRRPSQTPKMQSAPSGPNPPQLQRCHLLAGLKGRSSEVRRDLAYSIGSWHARAMQVTRKVQALHLR